MLLKSPEKLPESQVNLLKSIQLSALTLLRTIGGILDLTKDAAGKLELDQKEFDIIDEFHNIIHLFSFVKFNPKIELIGLCPFMYESLKVLGDRHKFKFILQNLVANSIKFTSEGIITVKLKLGRISVSEQEILISVKDTGPGLTPEEKTILLQKQSHLRQSQILLLRQFIPFILSPDVFYCKFFQLIDFAFCPTETIQLPAQF